KHLQAADAGASPNDQTVVLKSPVTMCRLVPGPGDCGVTGLFRTTVWSFGLAPASAACRCLSASSRVLKIRKKAFRPSMSKTTFTFGWTLTREMPPFSGVTESDRLIRYPRPVE